MQILSVSNNAEKWAHSRYQRRRYSRERAVGNLDMWSLSENAKILEFEMRVCQRGLLRVSSSASTRRASGGQIQEGRLRRPSKYR